MWPALRQPDMQIQNKVNENMTSTIQKIISSMFFFHINVLLPYKSIGICI